MSKLLQNALCLNAMLSVIGSSFTHAAETNVNLAEPTTHKHGSMSFTIRAPKGYQLAVSSPSPPGTKMFTWRKKAGATGSASPSLTVHLLPGMGIAQFRGNPQFDEIDVNGVKFLRIKNSKAPKSKSNEFDAIADTRNGGVIVKGVDDVGQKTVWQSFKTIVIKANYDEYAD